MDLDALQARIGRRFNDAALLERAVTHPSYANEMGVPGNETLEYLGDAVVDLAASHLLFVAHPGADEGELSRRRSALVNEAALAAIARELGLGEALRLGRSETNSEGRQKPRVLADVVEALIGAIFLDAGYEAALAFIRDRFDWRGAENVAGGDPKTLLQIWAQRRKLALPEYRVESESGPGHDKIYFVSVTVAGNVLGQGQGRNKKEAEKQAAVKALEALSDA